MVKNYLAISLAIFENAGVPTLSRKRLSEALLKLSIVKKAIKWSFLTMSCKDNGVIWAENTVKYTFPIFYFPTNSESALMASMHGPMTGSSMSVPNRHALYVTKVVGL